MASHPSHISHEVPDWIALPQNPELALHNIFYTTPETLVYGF